LASGPGGKREADLLLVNKILVLTDHWSQKNLGKSFTKNENLEDLSGLVKNNRA
jgi:hypothetical protein